MWYGVSQEVMITLRFRSLPIFRILSDGTSDSHGGGNDETAKEIEVCT